MVHVQLILSMVQQVLYSVFHVQIGKIKMVFKIIHFIVYKIFFEDENNISAFLVWTNDISKRLIIAFSAVSDIQLLLPAGDDNTSLVNMIVHIRDTLGCITEYNI